MVSINCSDGRTVFPDGLLMSEAVTDIESAGAPVKKLNVAVTADAESELSLFTLMLEFFSFSSFKKEASVIA